MDGLDKIIRALFTLFRLLAFLVAVAFFMIGFVLLWSYVLPQHGPLTPSGQRIEIPAPGLGPAELAIVALHWIGAALLLAGVIRWYGFRALALRIAGFMILFVTAFLYMFSYAIVLMPLVLSLLITLVPQRKDGAGMPHRAAGEEQGCTELSR